MNLKKIILTLGLGTLAANALPHGNPNSLDVKEEWLENSTLHPVHPSLQERTLQGTAPITKTIGDDCDKREGLYVPFLYAAWMDSDSGNYERYQCDADEKGEKCHVKKGEKGPKRMVTDGLASCVSINVISKKGTIMTHIPPYVCQIINGDRNVPDPDGKLKQRADNIKKAVNDLKKDHLKNMGQTTVVAITGPYINGDVMGHQGRVTKVVEKLFGMGVNKWEHLDEPMPHFDGERSTTVDMTVSPPAFYKENKKITIHVP